MSTEVFKFLSMNTSVEAVDRLVKQSTEWKIVYQDMSRKVQSAMNTSTTVDNKCDELKEELSYLERSIVKLEQKK